MPHYIVETAFVVVKTTRRACEHPYETAERSGPFSNSKAAEREKARLMQEVLDHSVADPGHTAWQLSQGSLIRDHPHVRDSALDSMIFTIKEREVSRKPTSAG